MARLPFKGMMAPTFAPFKPDGSLNLGMIRPYAEHLRKEKIAGVWVNGSVGEGMSMTLEERKAVAEAWLACRDLVPTVIIHCGAVCLKDVHELVSHAESHKADGVAVIPSIYDRPTSTDELVEYMVQVAKACPSTPLFYYHVPVKTNVNLSMSEFLQKALKQVPTLSGIKFTDMDVNGEGRKCVALGGDNFNVFCGFDDTLQEALTVGFSCGINSSYNFVPHLGRRIYSLMAAGDADEAKKVQKQLIDCFLCIGKQTAGVINGAGLKAATILLTGLQLGPTRLPVRPFTEAQMKTFKDDLQKQGFEVR